MSLIIWGIINFFYTFFCFLSNYSIRYKYYIIEVVCPGGRKCARSGKICSQSRILYRAYKILGEILTFFFFMLHSWCHKTKQSNCNNVFQKFSKYLKIRKLNINFSPPIFFRIKGINYEITMICLIKTIDVFIHISKKKLFKLWRFRFKYRYRYILSFLIESIRVASSTPSSDNVVLSLGNFQKLLGGPK